MSSPTRKYRVMRQGAEIFSLDAGGFLTKYRAGEILPNDYYQTEGMKGWDFASKCHLITGGPAPALPQPAAPRPMPPRSAPPARGFGNSNPPSPAAMPPGFGGAGRPYNPPAAPTGAYGQQQQQASMGVQPAYAAPQGRPGSPDRCPSCNAKTIRTARAIYLAGTRDSTGSGTSFGWGRRSSPRSWVSQRTSRSRLAQSMAPPEDGSNAGIYTLLLVLLAIGTIWTIIIPILCFKWINDINNSASAQQRQQDHQRQLDEYDRTWYCSKCATKFVW